MKIVCPFCSHSEDDELEVLELDTLHDDFRCVRCDDTFSAYVNDCVRCGAEQLFVWARGPSAADIAALTCKACGHRNSGSSAHDADEHDSLD